MARLQDEITELVYSIENGLMFHGGTAIWRCYKGNRFSEDLNFYCKSIKKIEGELPKALKSRGLKMEKFKKTQNLVYCKISNQIKQVRLEINFSKTTKPVSKTFEKSDGSYMQVLSLSPEDLVEEKILAYKNRKFVRDAYDLYHLSNYADENRIGKTMVEFLKQIQPPVDEENLKAIVYSGNVPSFSKIVQALKGRYL